MPALNRVEVGFDGGQVLPVRLDDEQLKDFRGALGAGEGWHEVADDEGTLAVDLAKVVFVRIASSDQKVGF
ncbi:MAG: hypothetical protein JJE10_09925 [Thermoleophilia bacterium]|nr:hypothetical protein [Thermoleophilia bacterium]